jgi:phosphoserine phosphatase
LLEDAVAHKLDYLLPAASIGSEHRIGIKRDSLDRIDEPFTPRVQNCRRSPTINIQGLGPGQERHSVLTSGKSSDIVRLSGKDFIDSVLSREPAIAVFDCDGTLWAGDSGYDFMIWSIEEGLVSRNVSDWIDSRYRLYRAGKISELAICGEMVQIYDGLSELEIRGAAAVFFRSRFSGKVFPELRSLVASLQERGTDIWVVSSTNNWVVEVGVHGLDIPPSRVISARAAVVGGVITSKLLDVPTDEGKAESLIKAGIATPDVVFGNSVHDAAMLEIAQHAYAVNPTPALVKIAVQHAWTIFYPDGVPAV